MHIHISWKLISSKQWLPWCCIYNASKEDHFLHHLCICYQTWIKVSDDSVKPSLPVYTNTHTFANTNWGPVEQYYTSVSDRPATWLVWDPIDATIIWCEKQYSSIAWPHPHRVPGISCMSPPRSAMSHWHLYFYTFCIVYTTHLLFEHMPSSFRVWTISVRRRQQALALTAFTLVVYVQLSSTPTF